MLGAHLLQEHFSRFDPKVPHFSNKYPRVPPVHSSMRVDLRARTEASAQGTGGGGRGWAGRAELTTEGLWVPAWVAVGLRWKEFDFDKQRSRKSGRLRSG